MEIKDIAEYEEKDSRLARSTIAELHQEIERLNNIIEDFEEELERESNMKEENTCLEHNTFIDIRNTLTTVLKRFRELKENK